MSLDLFFLWHFTSRSQPIRAQYLDGCGPVRVVYSGVYHVHREVNTIDYLEISIRSPLSPLVGGKGERHSVNITKTFRYFPIE